MSDDTPNPIPVQVINLSDVKNYAPSAKPPYVRSTNFQTIVVDPANGNQNIYLRLCAYEPNRYRMVVQPLDAAVIITDTQPAKAPITSTTADPGNGFVLLPNPNTGPGFYYEFFGPDSFFIVAMATITRVSVLKEYCL